MVLKARVKKIEKQIRLQNGGKVYIHISIKGNADPDEELQRYLTEHGLMLSQVGYALLVGKHGCFEIDFGGYDDIRKLIGFKESNGALIASLNTLPDTLGPLQCRLK